MALKKARHYHDYAMNFNAAGEGRGI
jgi:hypothetical protein